MATVPMVVAVRRNAQGDVLEVTRGTADTDAHYWAPNGAPVSCRCLKSWTRLWLVTAFGLACQTARLAQS